MSAFTLCGTVIHAPLCGEVEILEAALVEVDDDGQILAVLGAGSSDYDSARKRALQSGQLQELSNTQYLLPGLIDLHIHASQWPQLGNDLHLPLDEWLQQCTFPLEAKYADLAFAGEVYNSLVNPLICTASWALGLEILFIALFSSPLLSP